MLQIFLMFYQINEVLSLYPGTMVQQQLSPS